MSLSRRLPTAFTLFAFGALPLIVAAIILAYQETREAALEVDRALGESTRAVERALADELAQLSQVVLLSAERLAGEQPGASEPAPEAGTAAAPTAPLALAESSAIRRLLESLTGEISDIRVLDAQGRALGQFGPAPAAVDGSATAAESTASFIRETIGSGTRRVHIRLTPDASDATRPVLEAAALLPQRDGTHRALYVQMSTAGLASRLAGIGHPEHRLLVTNLSGNLMLEARSPDTWTADPGQLAALREAGRALTSSSSSKLTTLNASPTPLRVHVLGVMPTPELPLVIVASSRLAPSMPEVLSGYGAALLLAGIMLGLVAYGASTLNTPEHVGEEVLAPARAPRGRVSPRAGIIVGAAIAAAATMITGVGSLHRAVQDHRTAAHAIARIELHQNDLTDELKRIQKLAAYSHQDRQAIANSRHERDQEVQRLALVGPRTGERVREAVARFDAKADELLQALTDGRAREAGLLTSGQPVSLGADVQTTLLQAAGEVRSATEHAEMIASAGTSGAILLTVLLAGLAFWRFEHTRSIASVLLGTEHSLRESERRLSSLVRNATDVIFIIKTEGVIKYKSPAAGLMWGWRPETLIGWDYRRIVHPDDHAKAEELISQTVQRPQMNVGAELRFQAASGAWRDAEVVAINLLDDTAVEGIVLTCRDITYRKRAEDKIRSMNAELEQRVVERTAQLQVAVTDLEAEVRERRRVEEERSHLLQEVDRERATLLGVTASMTDGLLVIAPGGEIRFCNRQAGMLLSIDPEDVAGKDIHYVWWTRRNSFDDPDRAWTLLEQAIAGDENGQRFEVTLTGVVTRDIVFDFFPLNQVIGGDARTGIILRDVTAERNLDRTKDELISVVSHELRTPLTSLVGFAELLLKRDLSDDQRKKFVGVMLDEGKRLTTLLNDFLDLQRIESGRQQLSQKSLRLASILERAASTITAPDHPISVEVPDSLPAVFVDPDRVQQVLSNLLSNAKKYSPDGGEIRISASVRGAMVEVAIADEGLGIPPEALPNLFQKFYRIDNSDRRAIKGTGLGLAICRRIVEEHGGEIWAESPGLGHGSTIRFTLPMIHATDVSPLHIVNAS